MSAFKGTPGPWQVGEDGDVIWGAEWKGRKTFVAIVPFNKTPRTKADARLIAAAPELLEALIDCRRVLELLAGATRELAVVDAAIAKATGAQGATGRN